MLVISFPKEQKSAWNEPTGIRKFLFWLFYAIFVEKWWLRRLKTEVFNQSQPFQEKALKHDAAEKDKTELKSVKVFCIWLFSTLSLATRRTFDNMAAEMVRSLLQVNITGTSQVGAPFKAQNVFKICSTILKSNL